MYNTTLIPTDGSESAARAGEAGLDLAERYDATVHAVHVVDTSEDVAFVMGSGWEELRAEREQRGRESLADLADRAAEQGIDVRTSLREGAPYEEILAFAREHDVDLIVLGAHGTTGTDRHLLLGSVTEKVVRASSVPVHVVRTSDVAVGDVGAATSMAREALGDVGLDDTRIVDVQRSGPTWLVRARDPGDGALTVAIDIETGEVRVEDGDAEEVA